MSLAHRPFLANAHDLSLIAIEEEPEDLPFTPASGCFELSNDGCVNNITDVADILDELESLALATRELPVPKSVSMSLAEWGRALNIRVIVAPGNGGNSNRNAIVLSATDVSGDTSLHSMPSEDLFEDPSCYHSGGSGRSSSESAISETTQSSQFETLPYMSEDASRSFPSFALPPSLCSIPELVNVQRHRKLVQTLGLEAPGKVSLASHSPSRLASCRASSTPRTHRGGVSPRFPSAHVCHTEALPTPEVPKPSSARPSKISQALGLVRLFDIQLPRRRHNGTPIPAPTGLFSCTPATLNKMTSL
ncbi:unnamed protein product [Somion occarium]|uniref:Uncharacterized protein n=1 Tax=Somion occarium TaxID=3059160 RepID=A0ABP1DTH4_9APHY